MTENDNDWILWDDSGVVNTEQLSRDAALKRIQELREAGNEGVYAENENGDVIE